MKVFKLPDLGEGLIDAEIVAWHVAEGDTLKVDQPLVSVETAKAVVDLPSPISGRITRLCGKPGDIIKTGEMLVEYENDESERVDAGTVAGKLQSSDKIMVEPLINKATPAVRALAHRLKVDLAQVTPSGPNNTITMKDVQAAEHNKIDPRFTPLSGVRRAMAETLTKAHHEIVPVTVVEDARLMNWQIHMDISVHLIQAIIKACAAEPALNAWYDGKTQSQRLFTEVHLGVAMDTQDGLFVPVIKHAETLSAKALRLEIERYKKEVSNRAIAAEDLRGASITVSNFGKFVGRYANPSVVPPMVAIIGAGRIRKEMIVVNDEAVICPILPLSLTFDHRAVTGGEATRFLSVMIQALGELS